MTVSSTLTERLPRLVETHVYLLVAEAVERAVDHGRAARVQVTADLATSLVVTVVDDGVPPAGVAAVDAVRVVLVALLPWAWSAFGTPGMLVLAAALGLAGAVFDPNLGALVPDLVRSDEVQAVNGLMDLTGRIARVAGPGAAGALLVLIPQAALFWLDAATFAVSAAVLAVLGRSARPVAAESVPSAEAVRLRVRSLLHAHPATGAAIAVHGAGIFAQAAVVPGHAEDHGAAAVGVVLLGSK
ncbi:MFS transporter [Streptomyces sp. KR55]|uniref:MFS transporter n=1 Tax=Streptomyces sp. KR55 TaxID=3457425 RepID=UPI003FD3542B